MSSETERTVEIKASPVKLITLVGLGVLMTLLSVAVAVPLFPDMRRSIVVVAASYAGAVFFGLCTLIGLWRLVTQRGPVVTITPEGIRDVRVAAEVIPWAAVRDISTWEYSGQKTMVLAVDPATEARLTLTPIARWTRGANRGLGADGLCITAQGLKIGYDRLLATAVAYARGRYPTPD